MTAPTALQLEVLRLIAKSIRERGYPPTLRELGKSMGRCYRAPHALALNGDGTPAHPRGLPGGVRPFPMGAVHTENLATVATGARGVR